VTPARWEQVKALFQAATEREPHERASFLAAACAGDDDLRAQVEALLAAHEQAGSFIEAPALEAPAFESTVAFTRPPDTAQSESLIGRRIGPYKLLHEIGHGGMGAVYLAVRDDDQFRKRVAVKVVKRGMDTESILRRFRHERQILASLDHPNTAKLLDGGTTEDGRPYFVMEYIEGSPITEYCDRHKLSIVERLKLFRTVCAAVHHAHQNLVVHRDLKPSNIIITADGVPKLLDFGIAKLLNPELASQTIEPTAPGLRLMTPEYASPEQVRGDPITTASDVYSLGVILYELLTGHRPYRLRTPLPHEILRIICEQEPEKPSTVVSRIEPALTADGRMQVPLTPESVSRTREGQPEKLRRRLKGDLDNIVMMALRKEPQRRYGSVEQFAEDIRRHLEGLPVIARQDTLGYRLEKFMLRHKVGMVAATAVLLALLGGIAATLWQARAARVERENAQQLFNAVRELAFSFLFEVRRDIETLPGSTQAQRKLVERALATYDQLAQRANQDRSLQLDLAAAYATAGHIQWNRYQANLGDQEGAWKSQHQALQIRQRLVAADPTDVRARSGLAASHLLIGDLLAEKNKPAEALESYRQSLKLREEIVTADPANQAARYQLMLSYQRVGDTLGNPGFTNLGDPAGALEHYQKMLKINEEFAAATPKNPDYQYDLRIAYEKIRDVRWALGDQEGAFAVYRQALAINEQLVADYPHNAWYRRDLAIMHGKFGDMQAQTGDTVKAMGSYLQSLQIRRELAAADPNNAAARRDLLRLVWPFYELATLLLRQGQTAEARRAATIALALLQERAERPGATADELNEYAFALSVFEPAGLRNPATALSYAKQAVEMSRENDPLYPLYLDTLAWAYHQNGAQARALEWVEKSLARVESQSAWRPKLEADRAKFQAALHAQRGERDHAIAALEQGLKLLPANSERRPIFEADLARLKAEAQPTPKR
jgi:serine/threonine protein kinase/tetratricopeptide (TPR) repeat protein